MEFRFTLEDHGEKSHEIVLRKSFWTGVVKVTVGGRPVQRLRDEKGLAFPVAMMNGTTKTMVVKTNTLDYVPKILVDGLQVRLARPLFWYEYAIAFVPLALLFLGGALGGFWGAVGVMVNLRILRIEKPLGARALIIAGSSLLTFFVFLVCAALAQKAMGK